ncbi:hypothetical protein chiPu_0027151, partial [Chiloscyllium punctatum]|nr:hypothetical protein [Chiloscyllium punctatum]
MTSSATRLPDAASLAVLDRLDPASVDQELVSAL